jgi:hypothetical protein
MIPFSISGSGGADDGHQIKINGVEIFYWDQFVSYTFGPISTNINIGDILNVYNVDNSSGYCWCAGNFVYSVTYNGNTWPITWGVGETTFCYCGDIPTCTISPTWTPAEYPALIASFRLDASGPVSIGTNRFICPGTSSSSTSSSTESFSSNSSNSSSSFSSSSTSSGDILVSGITYYSNFFDINSINNPLMDNNVKMQYGGYWEKNWSVPSLDFDNFGYGLKRTKNSLGSIFCSDTSKLFSMQKGYLQMVMSLPDSIVNGVYAPLVNDAATYNEYILWGTNVGQYEVSQPTLYAALTPNGIEFTVWTSAGRQTITDITTNTNANSDILMEFAWDNLELDNYLARVIVRVNNVDVAVSNVPIYNDTLSNINFYALNTPYSMCNFECTIRKLVIFNKIPDEFIIDWRSTSSESTSSSL